MANPDWIELTVSTLGAITDYVSDILDEFGEGGYENVRREYYGPRHRELLDEYIVRHEQMQADYEASMNEVLEQLGTG